MIEVADFAPGGMNAAHWRTLMVVARIADDATRIVSLDELANGGLQRMISADSAGGAAKRVSTLVGCQHTVLGQFDNKYGTRSYTFNGASYHAYDGDNGWDAFMNTQVRPVLDNDLRQQIADVSCAQLNAACALVKDATQAAAVASGKNANVNYAAVQGAINSTLQADIDTQLGGAYLTNVRFTLVKADLPSNVQDAANSALAAFAQVSQQQALVQQAQLQAQANEAKQSGYNACPACEVIDELKALPPNLTTFAPGAGTGIAIGTGK